MNKMAIASFICSAASFGGAIYRFTTSGVSLSPLMLIGIGSCLASFGFIKTFDKKNK